MWSIRRKWARLACAAGGIAIGKGGARDKKLCGALPRFAHAIRGGCMGGDEKNKNNFFFKNPLHFSKMLAILYKLLLIVAVK